METQFLSFCYKTIQIQTDFLILQRLGNGPRTLNTLSQVNGLPESQGQHILTIGFTFYFQTPLSGPVCALVNYCLFNATMSMFLTLTLFKPRQFKNYIDRVPYCSFFTKTFFWSKNTEKLFLKDFWTWMFSWDIEF